jgi:hypothetical protein
LRRIIDGGEKPAAVFENYKKTTSHKLVDPMQTREPPTRFAVTIADLGSFSAETYAADLYRWATATFDAWRGAAAQGTSI